MPHVSAEFVIAVWVCTHPSLVPMRQFDAPRLGTPPLCQQLGYGLIITFKAWRSFIAR